MKRVLLLLFSVFWGISISWAQNMQVKGIVLSKDDSKPIIGAYIIAQGQDIFRGTTTDAKGQFEMEIPTSVKYVEVSCVGYERQRVAVSKNMRIVLETSNDVLEEVVVIGYGSGKKIGSVVGAVAKVNQEKLESRPLANAMDALQGQVTGLQVYTSSGEPGEVSSSYIRGVGSLTADNEPLYIMDGSPVSVGVMLTMNPNDFESITVLKDASATAIYGSRAANGVVYITTKRGKIGQKAVITVDGNFGKGKLARRVGSPMNSKQLLDFKKEYGIISDEDYDYYLESGVDTKWEKYFFRDNASTYQGNISIAGGGDNTSYFISGSLYSQDGIVPRSSYERYTFRSNIDMRPSTWMHTGVNIGISYYEEENAQYTFLGNANLNGGIFGTMLNPPYFNPYDENGNKLDVIEDLGAYNPELLSSKSPNKSNTVQLNGNVFLELIPVKGLTFRSQLGIDASDLRNTAKRLPSFPNRSASRYTLERFSRGTRMTVTNTLEYKFNVKEDHMLTLLIGQEGIRYKSNKFASQTEGQNDDRLTLLTAGTKATLLSADIDIAENQYLSFFGRINYNYKNKYYFDFTLRNDASSRFGANNRSATFCSGGFMWDIKQMKLLQEINPLTALKFKASVGSTGNSSIGNYDQYALVGTTQYNTQNGWFLDKSGDKNLGWEKQVLTNIGIEGSLYDRIRFDFAYYKKVTKDMLMDVPVPYTSGYDEITQNIGSMENKGVELSLSLDLIKSGDWLFTLYGNYSYNKNKITKIFYGYERWDMPNYLLSYKVGEPMQYYMAKYAGVDPEDGRQMWYIPDTDGETTKEYDGSLDQPIGTPRYAPHNGGFGALLSYKGLAISTDIAWVKGKYMVNNDRYFEVNPAAFVAKNQSKDVLKQWKQPGDITDIPAFGEMMQFDTHLLENASFLRMKNLTISYSLPKQWMEKSTFFTSVKLICTLRNVFTITSYKGADPEVDSNLTYGAYPNTRQYTLGGQIIF